MTISNIAQKSPFCQPLPAIPPDLILSDKDRHTLLEFARKLPPDEFQQLIEGYRIAQQKSGKTVQQLKQAICVEDNRTIISSTQKRKNYYFQTVDNRKAHKAKLEKRLKHLPMIAGWWRKLLNKKRDYALERYGDKEASVLKVKAFFHWHEGDWTLGVWWARIPNEALWDYAIAATKEYGLDHNPCYFIKCLHTAALFWSRFPEARLWREVVQHAHRFKNLSRQVLLCLLTAMMKAMGKSGSFGDWVRRFLLSPDGQQPQYSSYAGVKLKMVRGW
ncbi:hypothetical protein ES703_28677 [subsurface metagenome]